MSVTDLLDSVFNRLPKPFFLHPEISEKGDLTVTGFWDDVDAIYESHCKYAGLLPRDHPLSAFTDQTAQSLTLTDQYGGQRIIVRDLMRDFSFVSISTPQTEPWNLSLRGGAVYNDNRKLAIETTPHLIQENERLFDKYAQRLQVARFERVAQHYRK